MRYDDFTVSLDGGNKDAVWETKIRDGLSAPGILFRQMHLNKVDVFFAGVFADAFDSGILIHKAGGNDTGWDGDHADTEEGDDNAEQLSHCGDGIDVTVSDGQQCGNSPPDTGEGVGKDIRLRIVFQTVHTEAGSDHQDYNDENGREQLLALVVNNLSDELRAAPQARVPQGRGWSAPSRYVPSRPRWLAPRNVGCR